MLVFQIELDIAEAKEILEKYTSRESIKKLLLNEISRLEAVKLNLERINKSNQTKTVDNYKSVTNYAWDQVDQYVKIYLPLEQDTEFDKSKVELKFINSQSIVFTYGRNKFTLNKLHAPLDQEQCYNKVTKSKIILYLKKKVEKNWPTLTEKKEYKKPSETEDDKMSDDPSAALMNLMKKMYNEGDDNMKRTIAKSWYEAQNKKPDFNMDIP